MPAKGLDTKSAPGAAPEGKAPLVRNFLPEFPDKLVMRGPINDDYINESIDGAYSGDTNLILTGNWYHNDKILLSVARNTGGAGKRFLPPWKAPYLKTTNAEHLDQPNRVIVRLDDDSGETKTIDTGAEEKELYLVPALQSARIEDYTYGFGYGFQETFTLADGSVQALRPLLKWDGGLTKPVAQTYAPSSGQYVKSYLNRLWVLGGHNNTTTTTQLKFKGSLPSFPNQYIKVNEFTSGDEALAKESVGQIITGESLAENTKITGWYVSGGFFYLTIDTYPAAPTSEKAYEGPASPVPVFSGNSLYWSRQGGPTSDTAATWKDEVSGLVNQIVIGDDDRNDFGVALGVVNQSLIIFKRKSVWALYGYSPATFQVRNLTYEFGCVDPNSVCEAHYGIYFMSQNGLMYFNGESFTQVDEAISNIIAPLVSEVAGETEEQDPETYFGKVSVSGIGGGYLMLSIQKQKNSEPNAGDHGKPAPPSFVGILHMESGNWSEFTSDNLKSNGIPTHVGINNQRPWVFDGQYVTQIPDVTSVNDKVNLDSAHSPATAIPAKLRTDRIPLSSPGYMSQFNRIMQDYTWPNGATDEEAEPGWYITVRNADSDEILTTVQVPGHADPTGRGPIDGPAPGVYINGRRFEVDCFDEAADAVLEIEWKDDDLAVRNPELYDATFEVQLTRKRRTV